MRPIHRRHMLGAALAVALPGTTAWAQAFPSRPVRLIAVNPPGGLTDTVSRILQPRLSALLGQTVVVDNKPGANGGVAASSLMGSAPDGYSYIVADGSMVTVNPLLSKITYDPVKDFVPVSLIGQAPLFLVVNSKVPVNSLDDLVKLARSKPMSAMR